LVELAAGDEIDSGDLRIPDAPADSPFTIVGPLGECPHGTRYIARQGDVPVMLTIVDPVLVAQPSLRAELTRALQKARGVVHRSLLPILAFGRAESRFLIVEADPGGGTIRQFVHDRAGQNNRLDVETAHTLVAHVCNALGALEDVMVHGHVTADTIHVSNDGRVHLSGAGLGAILPQTRGFERFRAEGRLPNIAPEQLLTPPQLVTGTDVFGVATVFIELVTGKCLPEAGCPLSELGLRGPEDLVECLERATAPSPMARPPDAATFKGELAEAIALGPLELGAPDIAEVGREHGNEGPLPPPPPLPELDPDDPPGYPPPHAGPGPYPPTHAPPPGAFAGGHPPGAHPPGAHPQAHPAYPPGAYPPGAYPPGAYPPGAYPPGAYPPGAYPYPYPPYGYPYPYPHPPPGAGPPPSAGPMPVQGRPKASEAMDALDAATRRLEEVDADEIMDLTEDVDQSKAGLAISGDETVDTEASMLNLELNAFADAAERLSTLDGESASSKDPQVISDEDRSSEFFGSFSEAAADEGTVDEASFAAPVTRSLDDLADVEPTDPSDQRPLYFVVSGDKPKGPYSAFTLDRMLREGELLRTDEIRHRSFERSITVATIEAFAPALAARARKIDKERLGEAGRRAEPKAPYRPPPPARGSVAARLVLVLLALAALGAGAWYVWQTSLGG
jgi:hypothetical protein